MRGGTDETEQIQRRADPGDRQGRRSRLKHIVVEQTLDIQALKAVVAKKVVGPIARREAVGRLRAQGTSLRRVCRVTGLSTATWRYQRRPDPTNVRLRERLQAHAAERPRFG